MNIKAMRSAHLYLGVFFAPLLTLFLITGCWQTFGFHESSKKPGGYKAPEILRSFSQVHMNQRWTDSKIRPEPSAAFSYLVVLMSLGLLVTTLLGIVMAFKYTRPWKVWACLFWGIIIPVLLLWAARGFAQENSAGDEIVAKALKAEMFQIRANLKLTDVQAAQIQKIVNDNIVETRNLQLSLQSGAIDGKTMYDRKEQLIQDENTALSRILSPDQMKVWFNMQQYQ